MFKGPKFVRPPVDGAVAFMAAQEEHKGGPSHQISISWTNARLSFVVALGEQPLAAVLSSSAVYFPLENGGDSSDPASRFGARIHCFMGAGFRRRIDPNCPYNHLEHAITVLQIIPPPGMPLTPDSRLRGGEVANVWSLARRLWLNIGCLDQLVAIFFRFQKNVLGAGIVNPDCPATVLITPPETILDTWAWFG